MKYLLAILLITFNNSFQTTSEKNCLFEGTLTIRHQESNKEDVITTITMAKDIVKEDGFGYEYNTMITDYKNSYSQCFDKKDSLIHHFDFETPLGSTVKKLNLSSEYILGYKCIAYEVVTNKYFFEFHSAQFKTILWIAEDLNSCLYSQYKQSNFIYSNPLNKIALRVEKQIINNGVLQENKVISEVQEITPKKINYDLRDINNK
jgi:hypothetical protein